MRRSFLLASLFLPLISACIVTSENPLDTPPGTSIDPSPYLGGWHLVSILGHTPGELLHLSIAQVETNLIATISKDGLPNVGLNTEAVLLTSVAGDVIASVHRGEKTWVICRILLKDNGNRMIIEPMSRRVGEDISLGILEGESRDWGFDSEPERKQKIPRITATGADIRSYLTGKTNLFAPESFAFVK